MKEADAIFYADKNFSGADKTYLQNRCVMEGLLMANI